MTIDEMKSELHRVLDGGYGIAIQNREEHTLIGLTTRNGDVVWKGSTLSSAGYIESCDPEWECMPDRQIEKMWPEIEKELRAAQWM